MKVQVIVTVFLFLQSVTHLSANSDGSSYISRAKDAVAYDLKDPGSAKFRNVAVRSSDGDRAVCGEVNAKNAYGAYVGFREFYYWELPDKDPWKWVNNDGGKPSLIYEQLCLDD